MARHETFTMPPRQWVELTNGDTSTLSMQNRGIHAIDVVGTVDSTKPTTKNGAYLCPSTDGLVAADLEKLFGAGTKRAWGYSEYPTEVVVHHD